MQFFPSFLLFFLIFMKSNSENETALYCTTFQCGGRHVDYPFWVKNGSLAKTCVYQGFGLDCLSTPTRKPDLFFHLSDEQYFYVKRMNHRSLTLSESSFLPNNGCPIARRNLTIDQGLPLDYSNLDLLTFYYNCTRPLPFPSHGADCINSKPGSHGYLSYVSNPGRMRQDGTAEETTDFDWFNVCEQKVVTAVTKEEGTGEMWTNLGTSFVNAMNEGFVVAHNREQECNSCEDLGSNGRCGFNGETQKFVCFCRDGTAHPTRCKVGKQINITQKLLIGLGASASSALIICMAYVLKNKQALGLMSRRKTKEGRNLEDFIKQHGLLAPERYSYSYIKKMTLSFKDKLGHGGYGTVYRGKLFDGRLVAVKLLNVSKENGEDFINEVMSINRTSHVNVVRLLGFYMEGKRRALVYEYMSNGSLEKYIHYKNSDIVSFTQLELDKLYQISLGIARGLEYLHLGCNTRIMHFDIKPHNILLDEYFHPKISDFGMAKQCMMNESMISIQGARGTIGYIAPELVSRAFGVVSYKSGVYSYGMMILEIVGRRKNVSLDTSHASEVYFSYWAYQHLVINNDLRLKDVSLEEDEIAKKIILVGLWCVQSDPSMRPTMSKAIEMLEGELHVIPMPPKSFFGFPSTPLQTSSINSTTITIATL